MTKTRQKYVHLMSFHEIFLIDLSIISVSGDCVRRLFEICQISVSIGKCDHSISNKRFMYFLADFCYLKPLCDWWWRDFSAVNVA